MCVKGNYWGNHEENLSNVKLKYLSGLYYLKTAMKDVNHPPVMDGKMDSVRAATSTGRSSK